MSIRKGVGWVLGNGASSKGVGRGKALVMGHVYYLFRNYLVLQLMARKKMMVPYGGAYVKYPLSKKLN